jgi:protein phosphatase
MTSPITVVPQTARALPVPRGAGITHRGIVRVRNEDSILTDPTGTLWVVADGMGGYGHGDVASDVVVDSLSEIVDGAEPARALVRQIEVANGRIRDLARAKGFGQMGATVAAVMIDRAIAHVAWAGDSRVYLFRSGRLRLLTRDHTLVQDLVERGELTGEDAETHPEAHIVTRAVGGDEAIEVDTVAIPLFPGDRLLMCSDGLTRCVDDFTVAAQLAAGFSPEQTAQALLRAALDSGAPDNVSVIVIDLAEA